MRPRQPDKLTPNMLAVKRLELEDATHVYYKGTLHIIDDFKINTSRRRGFVNGIRVDNAEMKVAHIHISNTRKGSYHGFSFNLGDSKLSPELKHFEKYTPDLDVVNKPTFREIKARTKNQPKHKVGDAFQFGSVYVVKEILTYEEATQHPEWDDLEDYDNSKVMGPGTYWYVLKRNERGLTPVIIIIAEVALNKHNKINEIKARTSTIPKFKVGDKFHNGYAVTEVLTYEQAKHRRKGAVPEDKFWYVIRTKRGIGVLDGGVLPEKFLLKWIEKGLGITKLDEIKAKTSSYPKYRKGDIIITANKGDGEILDVLTYEEAKQHPEWGYENAFDESENKKGQWWYVVKRKSSFSGNVVIAINSEKTITTFNNKHKLTPKPKLDEIKARTQKSPKFKVGDVFKSKYTNIFFIIKSILTYEEAKQHPKWEFEDTYDNSELRGPGTFWYVSGRDNYIFLISELGIEQSFDKSTKK